VALPDPTRREEAATTTAGMVQCAFAGELVGWVGLGKGRLRHPAFRQPGPSRFAGRSTTNFLLPAAPWNMTDGEVKACVKWASREFRGRV
jgi:hypothetical protein